MKLELEEDTFQLVLDKIRRTKGLDFSLYRPGTIKRRLQARMRATGCPDYSDYIIYLNREPAEYDLALDALTINVTEFFRDPETFASLKRRVIPEIIRTKQAEGRKIIRCWSAGTCNGEEAYSLAVLFHELLGSAVSDFIVKVYGTDIDTDSLAKARVGTYAPASLKHVPTDTLQRYFEPAGETYTIKDEARELVRFQRHDLVSDHPLEHMDLILCRNVVIYFSRPLQDFVYSNFAKALNEGGFLVLGKVESLWGYPTAYFDTVNIAERIYRKKQFTRGE